MSTETERENEMLCERLLGWIREPSHDIPSKGKAWVRPDDEMDTPVSRTPTFLTGDGMLLLLEALDEEGIAWIISNGPTERDYEVRLCLHAKPDIARNGETPAAAVRSAALAYLEATK